MSTVSVIIPTWNRAGTLKRAILSVLNQTYPVTEILVCDDGSTDNSKQTVLEINDTRIKWIEGTHAGMPSIPRNRGIASSVGEWLGFLDSDDEWLPTKIGKQISAAEKLKTDAVCSNAFRIIPGNESGKPYLNYQGQSLSFKELIKCNYIICSSVMFKRSLLNTVVGFPESIEFKAIEDYTLWLRVATQTSFAYLEEPLVNYFDDPKQSIRSGGMTEAQQRKIILNNLLVWTGKNELKVDNNYFKLARIEYYKSVKLTSQNIFTYLIERFKN